MKKMTGFLVLLAALGVMAGALVDTVDARPAGGPLHNAYTLPRPTDFSSLEEWVTSNYTEYLILDSLRPATVGDYAAVSFSTRGEAGPDFNLLMDNGEALVLLTTARLNRMDADLGLGTQASSLMAVSCDTATNRCNCVYYARCKVPSLPYGLTYYTDKVRIINSSSAATGSVAIMNVGAPYGHVAVVTAVKKDIRTGSVTSITVTEANYSPCKITTRTGSPASLKVTGYFRP
jgi:hypothetical protein